MRFQNKTTMNKRTCRDFMALTWGCNTGAFRVMLLVVAAFAVGWGVYRLAAVGFSEITAAVGFFLMGALAFFLGGFGWTLRFSRYWRAQQELWGGEELEKELLVFEEEMVQRTKLGELTFKIAAVDGLLANRRCLVIRMGPNALLIRKDGFLVGSEAEFVDFMCRKIKENKAKKK